MMTVNEVSNLTGVSIRALQYMPTNATGKRESHNIYAKAREECEEKLAVMVTEAKVEKEKMTG